MRWCANEGDPAIAGSLVRVARHKESLKYITGLTQCVAIPSDYATLRQRAWQSAIAKADLDKF